jgi:hemerythrin superfamily protein
VSDTGYFKTENNLFTDVQSLQKDLYTDYSKEYLRILTDFDEKTGG